MRYLELKQNLKKFITFSLSDIRNIEPDFYLPRLSEWQKKGYIKKIIRGKYIFSDVAINEETMFLVANSLLSPSYVSLESALSWYGLIPEGVWQITSVSTVRTINFDTQIGKFTYRTIKPGVFFGDKLVKNNNSTKPYRIASIEKALLDYFYLRADLDSKAAVDELRLNPDNLSRIDLEILKTMVRNFYNQKFEKRVSLLIDHIQNA